MQENNSGNETIKIEIELTADEAEYLKQYAAVFEDERRSHGTRDPIVVVEDRKENMTQSGYNDDVKWLLYSYEGDCEPHEADSLDAILNEIQSYPDDYETGQEELDIDFIKEWFKYGEDELEIGICKIVCMPVMFSYAPVAYCLTIAEAKRYIKQQSHNLNHPRTYARCASGMVRETDLSVACKLLRRIGSEVPECQKK